MVTASGDSHGILQWTHRSICAQHRYPGLQRQTTSVETTGVVVELTSQTDGAIGGAGNDGGGGGNGGTGGGDDGKVTASVSAQQLPAPTTKKASAPAGQATDLMAQSGQGHVSPMRRHLLPSDWQQKRPVWQWCLQTVAAASGASHGMLWWTHL